MTQADFYDVIIVGGGLQGCLLLHALAHHRPEASVLVVEKADTLCGNHTWSFHATDVDAAAEAWLKPLITYQWPAYRVVFPGMSRRVKLPYATIMADTLRESSFSLARSNCDGLTGPRVILCGQTCEIDSSTRVILCGTQRLEGKLVVDCRGRAASSAVTTDAGFQTFIGCEYETREPWPVMEPTVMDARCDQADGFEFLYELPFNAHKVLLEYTRFSSEPGCDERRAMSLIASRLAEVGIASPRLVRGERGCLPMPYGGRAGGGHGGVCGGYAGGWYHAATGYSMPLAVRFAEVVATRSPENVAAALTSAASVDAVRRGFSRFLNRLLFCLVKPRDRWKVFRRFYTVLAEDRIARFYSHRFTAGDAARIVIGRPPAGVTPIRFAKSFISLTRPSES